MQRALLAAALLSACMGARAQAPEAAIEWGGKLQLQWDSAAAADNGPLAQAKALQPGTATLAGNGPTLAAELRAGTRGWNALVTLQQQALQNQAARSSSWVNELAYTQALGNWQFSAGKKIVSWDVGYAFRPNDLVQQELRRRLVSSTATGRGVLQAERFDSDSAWSLVAVNPGDSPDARAADEPALAARYYRHLGATDWYGFARQAERTGSSLGAAVAWVATDALELHASLRTLQRADTLAMAAPANALATQTPWRNSSIRDATQALLGAQWTSAQQLSVLLEAWCDGTALSPAQWDAWRRRNHGLESLPAQGAPVAAVAGNLAWQADAFAAASNLQRSSLYLRLAWEHEGWQPALELLGHPDDGGHMLTLSLRHQGDRLLMQGGLRVTGGPDSAVLAQLPNRQQAYLQSSWAF
jgi:hypothetical protein